jgi:hypothetical protein
VGLGRDLCSRSRGLIVGLGPNLGYKSESRFSVQGVDLGFCWCHRGTDTAGYKRRYRAMQIRRYRR